MIYRNDFQGMKVSALGFGAMRMPLLPGGATKDVDQAAVNEMVDYAMANGVKYFDTAAPYHDGYSEIVIGKALSRYPRQSYCLADKFPGHQICSSYDPKGVFEEQLKKCGVDYFDFYLMHNVSESTVGTYLDERWGIHDYFVEQKRLGRIRHLGFSTHGDVPCIEKFLSLYGEDVDFCQIQLNYVDWTLQNAKAKYDYLTARGLGVWVMEPLRGGKLSALDEESEAKMKALRPEESISAWSFRFLQNLPNVKVVLSGMSNLDQMKDNVLTFTEKKPLTTEEETVLMAAAEKFKNSVPCTGCRYCCKGCPMEFDIPQLIALYNDAKVYPSMNIRMKLDAIDDAKMPKNCIGCGQCAAICPQKIDIPSLMPVMQAKFDELPSWIEICAQREAAAKALREATK